ncbi:MAG: 3-oxoacid CoA-transferase subunit A [Candidatus Izimaplasma sp.]|nr:3-oxoacid CoA-transferase subunit A [Candidatus Izimaplasma bacterium]
MHKLLDISSIKEHLFDGMTIMVGGFMCVGTPEVLIEAIMQSNVQDLTIICNDAGFENRGVGKLIKNNQVSHLIASHIGLNPYAGKQMSAEHMTVTLVPQGTLAEQIRAQGHGLGGILTPTGVGTIVEENKEVLKVNNKRYLLETALHADLAIIEAYQTDQYGNVIYTKTTRNFNPIMAMAADKTIAFSREMVDTLDPECIITPHIFIDYVVKAGL